MNKQKRSVHTMEKKLNFQVFLNLDSEIEPHIYCLKNKLDWKYRSLTISLGFPNSKIERESGGRLPGSSKVLSKGGSHNDSSGREWRMAPGSEICVIQPLQIKIDLSTNWNKIGLGGGYLNTISNDSRTREVSPNRKMAESDDRQAEERDCKRRWS